MNLQDIAKIIEDDIKKEIIKAGHQGNGKLLDSIQVKFDTNKNEFDIEADYYIQYLDGGKFYDKMIDDVLEKVEPMIADYYAAETLKQINT
jgi:hypothetical protein